LSTINLTYVSSAIVGRPSVNTNRPVSRDSRCQRSTNGHNNSGSATNTSSAARSLGNSFTSTGNDSSHSDSGCGASNVSMHTPLDQKPHHQQGILTATPDGKRASQPHYFFLGK
jgi:hypothetical protein